MLRFNNTFFYASILILLLLWGCSENLEPQKKTDSSIIKNPVIQRIVEAGFKESDIKEYKDYYLVDGDILFYKNEKLDTKPQSGRTSQARSDFLVAPEYRNITVYLNTGSFGSLDLNTPLDESIAAFNGLGSTLQLSRVYTPEEAAIQIIADDQIGEDVCGMAGFPFADGRPFDRVFISEYTLNTYGLTDPSQLTFLLAHELGHCIGLRHTNWASQGEPTAIHINGTPSIDNASVMNGSTCGNYWGGLSYYDGEAIKMLYTNTPPPQVKSWLYSGESLRQHEFIRSEDGRFTFIMQGDGNLVLYQYNTPLWSSRTCCNSNITLCAMQGDGNLVLYDRNWRPYWSSRTQYYPGGALIMQNDGNAVIYQYADWRYPRWATNTCCR